MIKRPLGAACLIITGILYLLAEVRGISETEGITFSESSLGLTGTVYKKEAPKEQGKGEVLYLKDVIWVEEKEITEEFSAEPAEKSSEDLGKLLAGKSVGKQQNVICYLKSEKQSAEMGSRVQVRGCPYGFEKATNPGQFDVQFYYQISGISFRLSQAEILAKSTTYSKFQEKLYQLRCFFGAQLDLRLQEEDAAVMKAMLLGEKGSLDDELKDLYQRNGIGHILAISGLHVSLLGMGAFRLLRKAGMPIGVSAVLGAGIIFCYGIMTGFSVSTLRAVIMFLLHMLAKLIGRTYDMLTAVGVAAVLILIEQPLYFYYSGFVFSFGCVLGIGLLLPVFTESKKPLPSWCMGIVSGCAMGVISYPMYLWFYYQFPPYSVLLNLLVIPLMSFLMAAGLVLIFLQLFCPVAAVLPALMIHGILRIYEMVCNLADSLPGHMITLGKPEVWQLVFYLGVMVQLVLFQKKLRLKWRWLAAGIAVIVLTIRPGGELELTFLDVGQGDCIYIKSPEGERYLVDGGSSSVSEVSDYRIMPFLKYKGAGEIEAVIVTHPDEDHINGILTLLQEGQQQGISIKMLVLPDVEEELQNQAYQELEQMAKEKGIAVSYISAGWQITDGAISMQCLNPTKQGVYAETNEYSTVLKLTYGNFSALLTGDVEGRGEQQMLTLLQQEKEASVTVLKAAHHGSAYSTSAEMLELVKPVYTVISCGKNNSYGHPHQELLDRLSGTTDQILITYETGAVTFETNGKAVRVELLRETVQSSHS